MDKIINKTQVESSKIPLLISGRKETILEIKKLKKDYDGKTALKNINLNVKNGEFVSVIGSSGAGKSTLLRCINRMIEPTSGSIIFKYDNKIKVENRIEYNIKTSEITTSGKKELKKVRTRMAMIFQHYNLVTKISALENVLHGRLGHMSTVKGMLGLYPKEEVEIAHNLLNELNLKNHIYKKCNELSGGQKQRVGIARGLIQNPNIMLCDEPIASLDPKSSINIMEILKKVTREKNVPCLVNLHQVEIAKQFSDRIIGIKNGLIVFDGPPAKLTKTIIEKIYGSEGLVK